MSNNKRILIISPTSTRAFLLVTIIQNEDCVS